MPEIEDPVDANGIALDQLPAYDKLIHAEVNMQLSDKVLTGKVTRRAHGPNGKTYGTYHNNPFRNTIVYEVEFSDGQVREYSANLIAQNMLTQVDSEGYSMTLMEAIVGH